MLLTMLKAKIHRATVTQTDLNYRGSVTVDPDLLDAAGILRFEKVQVVDIDNGARLETYCLAGERGSGVVCLNGAAARLASVGDKVIIMAYCALTPQEAELHAPRVVLVGEGNRVAETLSGPPA